MIRERESPFEAGQVRFFGRGRSLGSETCAQKRTCPAFTRRNFVANEHPRRPKGISIGLWLAIGTAMGVVVGAGMGIATRNLRIWLGIGIAVGVAIGLAIGLATQRSEP